MGWDAPSKSVIRLNGRNVGSTIWDKDAVAVQPIDSLGHDTHDQDLADSISQCLHLGGINEMLADLQMGGKRVVGMAAGTQPSDAVTKQQLDDATGGSDIYLPLAGGTMTGVIDMGGAKITFLENGVAAGDAINKGQLDALETSLQGEIQDLDDSIQIQLGDYLLLTGGTMTGNIVMTNNAWIDAGGSRIQGLAEGINPSDAATVSQIQGGGSGTVSNLGNIANPSTVEITNTGGDNTTIQGATTSNAGVMTTVQVSKLDSLPTSFTTIDPGTVTGRAAVWYGAQSKWIETSQIEVPALGNQVEIIGGTSSSTYPFCVGGNSKIEGDLVVELSQAINQVGGGLACGGIAMNIDSLPNIEWNPNGDSVAGFQQSSDGTNMNIIAKTQAGGSMYFRYVRSSSDVTLLQALNGAQFDGPNTGALSTQMTQTEFEAMIDFFVTQAILTAARATEIKANVQASLNITSTEQIPWRNISVN